MELAQLYKMLNGVDGGADAAASLKKELRNSRSSAIKPKTSDTQDIRSFQTCSKYYSVL